MTPKSLNAGRLAWRTPTGAMLWEIWGQHKVKFLWQGIALAANWFCVHWTEHGAPQSVGETLVPISSLCFLGAYLHLLTCFGYIAVEPMGVRIGFPGRLLAKPVNTFRLVLVPMLFGGAIIVTVFALWAELVLRHLVDFDRLWISAVLLSFFWWMQALSWGLPLVKGRMFVVVVAALIHFWVWLMPKLPVSAWSGCRWLILSALLVSAMPAAWVGLKLIRQGSWEGPSRISLLWNRLFQARTRRRRKKFSSAFGAQFWLEWQRQGWLLPGISGGMALLIFPLLLKCFHWVGEDPAPPVVTLGVFILPLLTSSMLANLLAKFDRFHATNELPVYIAVRPMTNGGFVIAKLAMALATSVVTWLVTVGFAGFWLALLEKGPLFSKAGLATPYGPVAFMTGCVPVLLLLILWTWINLVTGIAAGLTGRAWMATVFSVGTIYIFYGGLAALAIVAEHNLNFKAALLHGLTGVLIVCLVVKMAVSVVVFIWGLRQHAITLRAMGWIIGGWSVGGLFVASYSAHFCRTINQPDRWIWGALGGFLFIPLAGLVIAPLALAWNRHR